MVKRTIWQTSKSCFRVVRKGMLRLWRHRERHCQSYILAEHMLDAVHLDLVLAHGAALPCYMLKVMEELLKSC